MSSSNRRDRAWDVSLVAGFVTLAFLLGCFRQKDADIWWHLKTGSLILERGQVPEKDWFTFTSADRDWIDLHWLFQLGATKLHQWGGMKLLTLASAFLGALSVAMLVGSRYPKGELPVAILAWLPALFLLGGRLYVRPEILTMVCLATFLAVLFHAPRHPRLIWLLVPVQVFWANVQGLFVLGLVLGVLYWIDGAWRYVRRRPSQLALRSVFVVSLVLASLVTPYGWAGLLFPLELFRKMSWDAEFYQKHIGELQSVWQFASDVGWWHFYLTLHLFVLLLGVLSFVAVWSRRQFDLFRLLAFAAFAWLGFQATRNSGQYALVVGAVTAWNFADWRSVRVTGAAGEIGGSATGLRTAVTGLLAAGLIAIPTGWFYRLAGEERLFGLGEQPLWHAHDAARLAAQPGMPDRMLAYHLGQAAVFEFHKREDQRTFCDPRLEVVSRQLLEEYHAIEQAIQANSPGWLALLSRHKLQMLLVDHRTDFSVESTLLNDPDWQCVFFDAVAGLYLHREVTRSLGLPAVDFASRHFHFHRSELAADVESVEAGGDVAATEPQAEFVEGDALFNIARHQHERFGQNTLVRTFALLGLDLARVGMQRFPGSIEGWRSMGLNSLLLGDPAPPQATMGTGDLAWDSLSMLDLVRSRYFLERALEFDRKDFATLFSLHGIAAAQKDREFQLALARRLVARAPRNPRERRMTEFITSELTKLDEHLSALGPPSDTPSDLVECEAALKNLLEQGRLTRAVEVAEQYVGRKLDASAQATDWLAGLLMRVGRVEEARAVWQQQLRTGGTLGRADLTDGLRAERIATTHFAQAQYGAAIEHYRKATELAPQLGAAWWGLVRTYLELGDAPAVVETSDRALANAEVAEPARSRIEWMRALANRYAVPANSTGSGESSLPQATVDK